MRTPSTTKRRTLIDHLGVLGALVGIGPPKPDETARQYAVRILVAADCEDEDLDDVRFKVAALLDLEAA